MALLVVFNWEVMVVLDFAQCKLVQFTGVFDTLEVRNDLLPGLPDTLVREHIWSNVTPVHVP